MIEGSVEATTNPWHAAEAETHKKLWGIEGVRELGTEYYRERLQLMREGQPTWMVRNTDGILGRDSDMGSGVIYDFAYAGKLIGYVEEETSDICDVYVLDDGGEPQALNIAPVTVQNAVAIIENFARYR